MLGMRQELLQLLELVLGQELQRLWGLVPGQERRRLWGLLQVLAPVPGYLASRPL